MNDEVVKVLQNMTCADDHIRNSSDVLFALKTIQTTFQCDIMIFLRYHFQNKNGSKFKYGTKFSNVGERALTLVLNYRTLANNWKSEWIPGYFMKNGYNTWMGGLYEGGDVVQK